MTAISKGIIAIAGVIVIFLIMSIFSVLWATERFFPVPDEAIVYSGGESFVLKSGDIEKCIDAMDKYVNWKSETHAAMGISEEDTLWLKANVTCIELIYNDSVKLGDVQEWEDIRKLLIVLLDTERTGKTGYIFCAQEGAYQPAPLIAFDEDDVQALLEEIPSLTD